MKALEVFCRHITSGGVSPTCLLWYLTYQTAMTADLLPVVLLWLWIPFELLLAALPLLLLLLLLQVRDPVAGVFSAETMLRGMGVPLTWSLTEPVVKSMEAQEEGVDTRFKVRRTWGPPGVEGGKGLMQILRVCSTCQALDRRLCLTAWEAVLNSRVCLQDERPQAT